MNLAKSDIICLDQRYSTTRQLSVLKQDCYQQIYCSLDNGLYGGLRKRGLYKRSFHDKPLVSIITVVFNGRDSLEETIKSVLGQSYDNVEYIIIDGGSGDGTLDIIRKYEEYIDFWISGADAGVYDAMNKGIDLAFGDWLNFMNAGDRLLNLDVRSLKKTSTCYYYDEEKKKILRRPLTKLFLCRNNPCHQSVFYNRKDILYYNLKYPINADYEQMTRIVAKIGSGGNNNSLVYYSVPGISKINSSEPIHSLITRLRLHRSIIKRNMGWAYFLIASLHSMRILLRKVITTLLKNIL